MCPFPPCTTTKKGKANIALARELATSQFVLFPKTFRWKRRRSELWSSTLFRLVLLSLNSTYRRFWNEVCSDHVPDRILSRPTTLTLSLHIAANTSSCVLTSKGPKNHASRLRLAYSLYALNCHFDNVFTQHEPTVPRTTIDGPPPIQHQSTQYRQQLRQWPLSPTESLSSPCQRRTFGSGRI